MRKDGYTKTPVSDKGSNPTEAFFFKRQRENDSGRRFTGTLLTRVKESFREIWMSPIKSGRKWDKEPE